MKDIFFAALCIILLSSLPATTFAGFKVKKTATWFGTAATNMTHNPAPSKKELRQQAVNALKNMVEKAYERNNKQQQRKVSKNGWEGTWSLVCGILGLFTGFFAIPALMFGALGMGKEHVHHKSATAGFIMGLVVVFVILVFAMWHALAAL